MRLFVAVDLPKDIKDELYSVQKSINHNLAKINFVNKKNLHLTLKFIGEYKNYDLIKERLSNIKFESFKVFLGEFGIFHNNYNFGTLWVELKPKDKVIELQRKVDQELIDLLNKDQKFSPHLTLGRVKSLKYKKEFYESLKNIKVKHLEFEIDNFYLVQSVLTKDGPIYKKLEVFKS